MDEPSRIRSVRAPMTASDWKNIAVSVLVSTALEIARDPAQLNAFLDFCAKALSDFVMRLPQLPIR